MKKRMWQIAAHGWQYLGLLLIIVFIWTAVFSSLDTVRDNQRLTLSVYNIDCAAPELKKNIEARLPTLTNQEILEIYVDTLEIVPEDTYAATLLTMQMIQTDLVIMPESVLEKLDVPYFFPQLPQMLTFDRQTYQINGESYGILISDGSLENNFSPYCNSCERCYLLVSATSYNLGAVYDRGEPQDDAALAVMKYLMGRDGV